MTITIDCEPTGSGPEDVTLSKSVTGSTNCATWDTIHWNGVNGLGITVQNGASVNMDIDYLNGLTNLPLWDIENASKGIKVDIVRPVPSGSAILPIYWDDSYLGGGSNTVSGCIYPTSATITGCHNFPPNPPQHDQMVNSWWYYLTQATISQDLVLIRTPPTPAMPSGPTPVCQGQIGVTYTVPAQNSTVNYIWTLPDGTTQTTTTNSITINFSSTAVSGTLFVKGWNTDCGYGLNSPSLFITVNTNGNPQITGPTSACIGTTSTFTITSGLNSYNWSVYGGNIQGSNTGTSVNILWNVAGNDTVQVLTTSIACPSVLTKKIITVNPLPVTSFSCSDTCTGALVHFFDTSTIPSGSITSWNWTFGDASAPSSLQNPTHTYATGGVYNVSLTTTSAFGCVKTFSRSVSITSGPNANAGLDATTCQNSPYTITTATASGYTSVLWSHNGQGSLSNASTLTPTYIPGVTENGVVVITLTANGNPPCGQITNAMNLTINPSATSFAGSNASICEGSTYTLSTSNAANYTSLSWTSSGTGTFNNVSVLHPVYTPSIADIQSGNVNLTLTANSLAACQSAVSAMTLQITRQVVADAGPAASMCQSGSYVVSGSSALFYSTLSWTHTGTGTLNNSSQLHPTYVPGLNETGTITLTLTANSLTPCTPVVDQMQLTIQPAANAFAGDNATICEGGSYTLVNSTAGNYTAIQWNTSGSGSFNNTGTLHPVYTPSPADIISGSVTLTLAASAVSPCPIQTSSMTLSITRQPNANAGSDASICQNNNFTVSGSTAQNYVSLLWTHTGTGSFNNSSFLHPVYTPGPGESGVITLTLNGIAASPCTDVNDQMQLTIDPMPVANAGPDAAICQGTVFNVTGASAQNAIAGGISWTETGTGSLSGANTVSPTYNPMPDETGDIYLTLEVHGALSCAGQTDLDGMILSISPFPHVGAGSNATICSANTYTLSGSSENCTVNEWSSSGDGTFSNLNQLNAVYSPGPNDIVLGIVTLTLTGTGSGACSAELVTDQMVLNIDPMPTVYAGLDEAFCVNAPIPILGANATNYSTITWSGGSGIYSSTSILSPTYIPGNADFLAGVVTLTLSAQGRLACSSMIVSDSRDLSITRHPVVNAGADDYICSSQTQYQFNGQGSHFNSSNIIWTFSGGDGILNANNIMNPTYFPGPVDLSTVDRIVNFTLTLEGVGNCLGTLVTDDVILRINPTPLSDAGPDGEICDSRPYQLTATAQYQSVINWVTNGDGSFNNSHILNTQYTPGPNDVGNTIMLSLNLSGCNNLTGNDFMFLTVHPDPTAQISGNATICEQTSTPLTFTFTGTPPWDLTYTNGIQAVTVGGISTSPYVVNVSPNITSSYWISAASDANCTVPSDSITGLASITVNPLPSPFHMSVTHDGVFCESDSGVVIGLSGSQVGMVYQLNYNGSAVSLPYAGSGHPLIFGLFNTPGQYSVMGTNPSGNCSRSMSDTVIVIMSPTPVTDFTANLPCFGDTTFLV
ncbi:MAG: PKD domain-containing protein [Bacteroidales bacterium]|nr:PKD domain-containing protein [Bacteroidales bacterium]